MNTFIRKNIENINIWIGIVCSTKIQHDQLPEFLKDIKYITVDFDEDPKLSAIELTTTIKRKFSRG